MAVVAAHVHGMDAPASTTTTETAAVTGCNADDDDAPRRRCGQPVVARGMCRKHYLRAWRANEHLNAAKSKRTTKVCPPEHPHDLEGCWREHGCRCTACRHLRKMERQRHRHRLRAYGREDQIGGRTITVATVREHVVRLQSATGAGLERIADAAGVSRSVLLDVYFGPRGADKARRETDPSRRKMSAATAELILGLTAEEVEPAVVSSIGASRRLQGLVAIGYTQTELAERLGMGVGNLSPIVTGKRQRVHRKTSDAIRELFKELWRVPKEGPSADRARMLARSHGWVSGLAWDDIDDPDEKPIGVTRRRAS